MGWDNASTIAGEVERPQRTYPLAMMSASGSSRSVMCFPLAARLAGHSTRRMGHRLVGGRRRAFGGRRLAARWSRVEWCARRMLNALCVSYSRVPPAIAEDGFLPRVFARLGPSGAPWVSILACAIAWAAWLGICFERLVSLDCFSMAEPAARVRRARGAANSRTQLDRPFRVPGGIFGAAALGVPPVALLGFALAKNADERLGPMSALVFGLGVMLFGPILYGVTLLTLRRQRKRQRAEQNPLRL